MVIKRRRKLGGPSFNPSYNIQVVPLTLSSSNYLITILEDVAGKRQFSKLYTNCQYEKEH